VPARWFQPFPHERTHLPEGQTITDVFLAQPPKTRQPCAGHQMRGVLSYRDIVLGILALRAVIERLEGERVGIMLPASVGSNVVYMACLFAGKTPVLVNWTTGTRNIVHALRMLDVKHV